MTRSNDSPSDFQSIILALQHFWADQGCLIWQPYYTQVGAGTMNPATFLRVLGPEPWNVAYVEPSVRPDDGRYGENPNRFQMHYQMQVILKPDPGNPQEIYLKSLEALGIDPRRHDIRFVEDNWESPALGAWGLGWEVWLDGQEITQFTYFQQAGGLTLNPVSVEITYGLDRIAMALQRVSHFRQLRWNEDLTAGDLNYQGEFEHSKYYFEIADVDRLRQMYALFEAEAEAALAANLVLPAHDYILKCSHTFNVLDTRGAVGVTERQALFGRMRDLSHRVAEAYLAQRQQLEYPFMQDGREAKSTIRDARSENGERGTENRSPVNPDSVPSPLEAEAPFLLEIGTEELPANDLDGAIAQLEKRVPAWLDDLHLAHGAVRVMGTPRRLVVFVEDLATRQEDREVVHKGPPAERAFDLLGVPTKAAEGFARSRGVALADLQVREMDGGRYTVAVVQEKGQPSVTAGGGVLSAALPGLLAGIKFDKPMRWNSSGVYFSRPIRWLLTLHGGQVVPFEFAGLRSGRVTRGLRFSEPEQVDIGRPEDYFAVLEQQEILLDPEKRRASVAAQVEQHTRKLGGMEAFTPGLVDEVTNLVERPTAFTGRFEKEYLDLPTEVLISVMEKHQRYFSVLDREGKRLLPHFIGIRNGDDQHLEVVADGNEQVIRARFADAAFFIQDDLKQPLEAYVPRLATLMFQKKLGSMLDKTRRIQRLVEELIPVIDRRAGAAAQGAARGAGLAVDAAAVRRAAELSKADLVTKMVVEMTSLQGVMGAFYARRSGEPEAVAQAIYEHYLPRSTGDQPPGSLPGLVVGLADRLDTLTGLFAAGLAPSGTRDPFAQRRAALGLVQSLIAWDMDFDLRQGIRTAASVQPVEASDQSQAATLDFIIGRLRGLLLDQNYRYDVVDAVLAEQGHNPAGAAREVKALAAWVKRPDWVGSRLPQILPAYARCVRITRDQPQVYPVDPAAFVEVDERDLYQALQAAEAISRRPGSVDDFLNAFLPMIPAINRFFDTVLVMAEDETVRRNRLGLLQRIAALADGAADLSQLEGF